MIYKDWEILARVCSTFSDLYELDDDGSLADSLDIKIFHDTPDNDDRQVVWYEVAGQEHVSTPFDDPKTGFFATIEDAKKSIDWGIEQSKDIE